jgi:CheY-like chemotaxis protein
MLPLQVLVIGQPAYALAAAALDALAVYRSHPLERAHGVTGLPAALALLEDPSQPAPQLIVLDEPRPGMYDEPALASLRRAAPLARIVRVGGSWCEGRGRSGRSLPGCQDNYWHQWPPRLARALEAMENGRSPDWARPQTLTLAEQVLACTEPSRERVERRGLIAISADSAPAAAALAGLCRGAGYQAVVVSAQGRAKVLAAHAVLWDTRPESLADREAVAELKRLAAGAPVLAFAGFPRTRDVAAASEAGIAAVISKPYLAADVLWQLDHLPRTVRC